MLLFYIQSDFPLAVGMRLGGQLINARLFPYFSIISQANQSISSISLSYRQSPAGEPAAAAAFAAFFFLSITSRLSAQVF